MKLIKLSFLTVLLLLVSMGSTFAQDFKYEPKAKLTVDPDVKVGKLKNGLTYYIRKNSLPENKAQLRLVVNAGAILENDQQQGLAHFLEHMAFNGTKNFPKNELIKTLESLGVRFGSDLNAYTSFDETVYMIPIASDKIDVGFQVLQDWAFNLNLEGEDIDAERGVILEELRLGKGAGDRMREKYFPVMLYGSKYPDRLPIGKEEVLKNFTHDQIRNFYKDWYRPNNMAIIAVGDFDVAQVEKQIIDLFSAAKNDKKAPKRVAFDMPQHKDPKAIVVTDKEMTGTQVQLLFKHQPKLHTTQADYVQQGIEQLYGMMISERLAELTKKPNPPFMYGGSFYGNMGIRPLDALYSIAVTAPGASYEGFKALLIENERVQRHGFTQGELDRAKANILSSYEKSYANRNKRESKMLVDEYQRNFLVQEAMPGIEAEFGLIKAALPTVTLADINALSSKLITDANRVVMVMGPEREGVKYPTEAELLATFAEVEKMDIAPYAEAKAVTALMSQTPKAGKVVSEKKNETLGITEWTLSNGAKVVLKSTDFKQDEVMFYAISKGGRSMYGAEDDFNVINATSILRASGINGIKATDLEKYMAGKNVHINPSIGTHQETINGSYVEKDAKTAFELLYLNFTAPFFDKEAFEVFKTKEKAQYTGALDNPANYFNYERAKFMANGNVRMLNANTPMPEDFDKINLQRVEQIYKERFAGADDFTFVFVGSFTPEQIKPLVEQYIASLPAKGVKETFKDISSVFPKGGQEVVFNKGVDEKAAVRFEYRKAATYSEKEAYDLEAFGRILSTRLLESLREEMGGTYGAGSSGQFLRQPKEEAALIIAFGTNLDMYKDMYDRALVELKKLQAEGPTDKEIAAVKEQQGIVNAENLKKNNFWLSGLVNSIIVNDPYEPAFAKKQLIDNLNAKDVKAAGVKLIDADQYVRFINLPEKK